VVKTQSIDALGDIDSLTDIDTLRGAGMVTLKELIDNFEAARAALEKRQIRSQQIDLVALGLALHGWALEDPADAAPSPSDYKGSVAAGKKSATPNVPIQPGSEKK